MKKQLIAAAILSSVACLPSTSQAAIYGELGRPTLQVESVQYWGWDRGPRWGWFGGPYWFHRPWAHRPYYGTIVAGVALGTIIGVTAVGVVPRRPAPDLCWYWVDRGGTRGYWDYCY